MTWGLVIAAAAVLIAWRRNRLDVTAVGLLVFAIGGVLAYTYRSLGG